MHKRLLSIFLSFCMVMGYAPVAAWAAGHTHCVCVDTNTDTAHVHNPDTTWTPWNDPNALPTNAGNYYLTTNINFQGTWHPTEGTVICMNGKNMTNVKNPTAVGGDPIAIYLGDNLTSEPSSFILTDCSPTEQSGILSLSEELVTSLLSINNGSDFTMYNGRISGNRTPPRDQNSPANAVGDGAGVKIVKGCFNMYGGMISDNTADRHCGGVYVGSTSSIFNMYGGTIMNNTAPDNGGGVYVSYGTFHMYGGNISDNTAKNKGGGVYVNYGKFYMHGGTISKNQAAIGGGIYNNSEFTIEEGTISDNDASDYGGGVVNAFLFQMYGGTICENTAADYGGGVVLDYQNDVNNNPIENPGYMQIGGKITITENQASDVQDNLYLVFPETIEIQTPLEDAFIGLTAPYGYDFTEGDFVVTAPCDQDYSNRFFSDQPNQYTVECNKAKQIVLTKNNGYTVTFDPNGGIGEVPESITSEKGSEITVVQADKLSKEGYFFTGWNTKADGSGVSYAADDTLILEDSMILYAQWEAAAYTLSGKIVGQKDISYVSVNAYLESRGADNRIYQGTVYKGEQEEQTGKTNFSYTVAAPPGEYTLVVETATSEVVAPPNRIANVKLKSENETRDVNLPSGQAKVKTESNTSENKAEVMTDTLYQMAEQVITENDAVKEVEVEFAVSVPAANDTGKEKIEEYAPLYTLEFVDFSIKQTILYEDTSKQEKTISEVEQLLEIVIPFERQDRKGIKAYRFHDNAIDVLTETANADGERIEIFEDHIVIYAKKFSTYAVAYVAANEEIPSDPCVIAEISSEGSNVNVKIVNGIDEDAKLFVAAYDENGKMLHITEKDVTAEDMAGEWIGVSLDTEGAESVSAFLLKADASMQPITAKKSEVL